VKLRLEHRLEQIVSGQIVQLMKLLQANRIDIDDFIEDEIEQNPLLEKIEVEETLRTEQELEIEKDDKLEYYLKEFEWLQETDKGFRSYVPKRLGQEKETPDIYAGKKDPLENFKIEFLSKLDSTKDKLGNLLLSLLDENGFLRMSPREIADKYPYKITNIKNAIKKMKNTDPYGVGCNDMLEFITFQLEKMGYENDKYMKMLTIFGKELKAEAFEKISRKTGITVGEIKDILIVLRSLKTIPLYNRKQDIGYIIPDVIIRKVDNKYIVILNEDEIPAIRINSYYLSLIKGRSKDLTEEERKNLRKYFYAAKSFINNLYKRRETIERIAKEILNRQYEFFEKGIGCLKPLYMKDIAETLSLSNSTITRALANKYYDTPQGIFPSKFFFINRVVSDIDTLTVKDVKNKIEKIINSEDKKDPFSDEKITGILNKQGLKIVRRTIAKYRSELNIPNRALRKKSE